MQLYILVNSKCFIYTRLYIQQSWWGRWNVPQWILCSNLNTESLRHNFGELICWYIYSSKEFIFCQINLLTNAVHFTLYNLPVLLMRSHFVWDRIALINGRHSKETPVKHQGWFRFNFTDCLYRVLNNRISSVRFLTICAELRRLKTFMELSVCYSRRVIWPALFDDSDSKFILHMAEPRCCEIWLVL